MKKRSIVFSSWWNAGMADPQPNFLPVVLITFFYNLLGSGRGQKNHLSLPHPELEERWAQVFQGVIPQESVSEVTGLRWSREVMFDAILKLCAVDDKPIQYHWQFPFYLAEQYWKIIAESAQEYPGANELLQALRRNHWQIVVVSSTDGRMKSKWHLHDSFFYVPEFSRECKEERLRCSPLLTRDDHCAIGDPIGKPDPRFWRSLKEQYQPQPNENVLVMGDSYRSDLQGVQGIMDCYTILAHGTVSGPEEKPNCSFVAKDLHAALGWLQKEKILSV